MTIPLVDKFLNTITMYRLVLYGLGALAIISIVLALFGILPFSPWAMLVSLIILLAFCFGTNVLLSQLSGQPLNIESADITALILFFILVPPTSGMDMALVAGTAFLAMISKHVFALQRKHIFNPAAIALVIMGVFGSGLGIWWVATPYLLPLVLILAFFVVRKIRRFPLFFSFLFAACAMLLITGLQSGASIIEILSQSFVSYPLLFLGGIMLTEPLTTPPTKKLQTVYGAVVGVLFGLQFHLGPFYSTPELAIVLGNIFSYIVSPKEKLKLALASSRRLSADIYEFVFSSPNKLLFKAGQYLEWTLPRFFFDDRGNRRYFTIASSPTEHEIRIGVRVSNKPSRFKKALLEMKAGETIWASQLAGDFVLPNDVHKKLVFIAGGIGITPFRSMLKYIIDVKEQRDIVLLYACITKEYFVYQDIFNEAAAASGVKTVFLPTDTDGYLTPERLAAEVPDFKERIFYLSGPISMVNAYQRLLLSLHVARSQIMKDYFPGF